MSTPILSSVSCFVYVHPKTPRASACAAMHGSGIVLRADRVDGCCYMTRGFFIGHRRYAKDGHWIRDGGFLIRKRSHAHQKR